MNQKIIDKIESIDQLLTKLNWIDSEVYVLDQGMIDLVLGAMDNKDSQYERLFLRVQGDDPLRLFFEDTVRKRMVQKVFEENAVIISNKLTAYFLMRSVQNEWPQVMGGYVEGIDFDFSVPPNEYNCYYLFTHYEILGQTMLDKFNKM